MHLCFTCHKFSSCIGVLDYGFDIFYRVLFFLSTSLSGWWLQTILVHSLWPNFFCHFWNTALCLHGSSTLHLSHIVMVQYNYHKFTVHKWMGPILRVKPSEPNIFYLSCIFCLCSFSSEVWQGFCNWCIFVDTKQISISSDLRVF